MTEFKDKDGTLWSINLTIGLVERVKKASGWNLYEPDAPAPAEHEAKLTPGDSAGAKTVQDVLWTDLSRFWELLWHLVQDQAAERKIDAEAFGRLMAARCLIDAHQAFWHEWADFFRQLQRPDAALVLEKMETLRAAAIGLAEVKLRDPRVAELEKRVLAGMEETVERDFAQALSDGYGTLRELSGSIPDPSP
jgi:hypothetical protein